MLASWASTALAQKQSQSLYYGRTNTFGVFTAYSGDSSHILMGIAQNRMLLEFGVSYSRKLFISRGVNWQYNGELLPIVLESDPMGQFVTVQTSPAATTVSGATGYPPTLCSPQTSTYNYILNDVTYSGTETVTCSGRRWTFGEAMSPLGLQWNFLPRHKTQPFLAGHGGYMYSTKPIPVPAAGSFNFTFDFGAGFEIYRSKTRSIRAEYRFHHISNNNSAAFNPGIDNGLFQVTCAFGR